MTPNQTIQRAASPAAFWKNALKTAATALSLTLLTLLAVANAGGTGASASGPAASAAGEPVPATAGADPEQVERGRYLVSISACNDCHTPFTLGPQGPEPDMTRMLSGHPEDLVMPPAPALGEGPWVWVGAGTNTAFAGPWGVSFTANLTPDASGLAAWDEEIFIRALRTGKHMGQSRPILPPMPWPVYRNMTDDDLRAVFAYLRTIPAISNHVPEPLPPSSVETAAATPGPAWIAD